jgi:hypothetical protein
MSKLDQLRALKAANIARNESRAKETEGKSSKAGSSELGQEERSRLSDPIKRGRPKITGQRPWEAEGMSRRTWYRRRTKK